MIEIDALHLFAKPSDAAGQGGLFAGPEFGASPQIAEDNRVGLFAPGRKLRLKKSGQEKVPVRQIEGAHFVARAACGDAQSGGFPSRNVFGISLEITEVLALQGIRSAQVVRERAPDRVDDVFSMHLGSSGLALRQGASDRRNYNILRIRTILGGVRIAQTQYIAGEFDQSVLESAAGTQIGQISPARELNAAQHAGEAVVGTAGNTPNTIEVREALLGIEPFERLGGKPARLNVEAEPGCGMKQSCFRRPMGMLPGIEVA
jgi:hypothetical protein